jgi:hypothetical protein
VHQAGASILAHENTRKRRVCAEWREPRRIRLP